MSLKSYVFLWRTDYILMFATDAQKNIDNILLYGIIKQRGDCMDVQAIAAMIGSLGFPIVACVVMFKYLSDERENNNKQRESDRQEHREEMQRITDALNNNTLVMQKLVDTLSYPDDGKHS